MSRCSYQRRSDVEVSNELFRPNRHVPKDVNREDCLVTARGGGGGGSKGGGDGIGHMNETDRMERER